MPSQADIQMTNAIGDIAPLGISVHDHIIAGKNGHARLEGLKLIPLASSTTARDATIWLF
jgi:DNA repair protein RadC